MSYSNKASGAQWKHVQPLEKYMATEIHAHEHRMLMTLLSIFDLHEKCEYVIFNDQH